LFFQKALKGIPGLSNADVQHIVQEGGITCNWWLNLPNRTLPEHEIKGKLTDRNLEWHLNHYDDDDPTDGNKKFRLITPFISVTAGAIERDAFASRNIAFPPLLTALRFATDNFRVMGWVFYCYVLTLGKKSVALRQFAEEVRELHIYTDYLPYHPEGELVAKINIPSVQIEKAELYDGPKVFDDLLAGRPLTPLQPVIINPDYQRPEEFSNIREVL
jgi:hypothetical protein